MYWIVEGLDWLLDLQHVRPATYYTNRFKYDVCSYLKPLEQLWPDFCDWSMTRQEAKLFYEVNNGSGTSIRNILHLGQQVRSKNFVDYDPLHSKKSNPNSLPSVIKSSASQVAG